MMRRVVVVVTVACAALALPHAASAGCGGVKTRGASGGNHGSGRAPLVIGDSVLLGAIPEASRAGFDVNAHGCRQFPEALAILRARKRAGTLPYLVVIGLGTNGTVSRAQWRTALRIMGPDRVLGVMTARESGGGSGPDATVARHFARAHPLRTELVDWVAFTRGRSGWFAGDGIHLGSAGAAGLGRLLRTTRREVPAPPCPA